MPRGFSLNVGPEDWTDPSRGVTADTIKDWMSRTPAGKRYAGWAGGSRGNVPVYSEQRAESMGQGAGRREGAQPLRLLASFSGQPVGGAQSAEGMEQRAPRLMMSEPGSPTISAREKYQARDVARAEDRLISTFMGGNTSRLGMLPEADRRSAALDAALRVKQKVGEEPNAFMHPEKHEAWVKERDKVAAASTGRAWWESKERAKAEQAQIETMMKLAAEDRARAKFGLDVEEGRRADTRLAWEDQDRQFTPQAKMLEVEGGTVPILMTGPRTATQARIEPLPTDLPAIGDKKGGLVFTGKVDAKGRAVYEQVRAPEMSPLKFTPQQLQMQTERREEILQRMQELDKEQKAGNKKAGADWWFRGSDTFAQERQALQNELTGITAALGAAGRGGQSAEGMAQGEEEDDPLGIL